MVWWDGGDKKQEINVVVASAEVRNTISYRIVLLLHDVVLRRVPTNDLRYGIILEF